MSMVKYRYYLLTEKSRSDDTLLTVDFNLRNQNSVRTLPSPAMGQNLVFEPVDYAPSALRWDVKNVISVF